MSVAYEMFSCLYETPHSTLAAVLEAARQDAVRLKVKWLHGGVYQGYVVHSDNVSDEPESTLYYPVLVWRKDSRSGFAVDPGLVESVSFANSSKGGVIWHTESPDRVLMSRRTSAHREISKKVEEVITLFICRETF